MRQNVLLAFEEAERTSDAEEIKRLTTIVVIGGGPTGVELAGAFAELTRHVLSCDFHHIDAQTPRIILLEVAPRILLPFTEKLSASAKHQLETLGVDVRLNQKIKDIDADGVTLENERIDAANIFWGAGVVGSPVLETMGIELARGNKIPVEPDCSVPGYPEVFAVGDIVALKDTQGKPVPGVSPAAMQMGRHVAKVIRGELTSGQVRPPAERAAFTYKDKGSMATIGRSRAVAQIGKLAGMVGRSPRFPDWLPQPTGGAHSVVLFLHQLQARCPYHHRPRLDLSDSQPQGQTDFPDRTHGGTFARKSGKAPPDTGGGQGRLTEIFWGSSPTAVDSARTAFQAPQL